MGNIGISITRDTTKDRIEEFRSSLNKSLKTKAIENVDRGVDLVAKVIELILLCIIVFEAIIGITTSSVPVSILVPISSLFTTLLFEIGYKSAIIKHAIDIRIQMVSFAALMSWFVFVTGLILYIQLYLLPVDLTSLPLNFVQPVVGVVAIALGYGYIKNWLVNFISSKLDGAIVDPMKPFRPVISSLSFHLYPKTRVVSQLTGFMLVLFVFSISENPGLESVLLSVVIVVFMVVMILHLFKSGTSFVSSLNLLWHYSNQKFMVDLMSYCLGLQGRLERLGITDYEIEFDWGKCVTREEVEKLFLTEQVICTYPVFPIGYEDVGIITLANRRPDFDKIQQFLNEQWSNGIAVPESATTTYFSSDISLGIIPPFMNMKGRIIIDDSVFRRDVVAWISGKPCFGIVFDSEELLKMANLTADCCV